METRKRPFTQPFKLVFAPFVVMVDDDEDVRSASAAVRSELAFHASTPAYHSLLDLHGWRTRGAHLHALSREGKWDEMADLVDDDMLNAFAVVCRPGEVERTIEQRFGAFVDGSLLFPEECGRRRS